MHEPCRAQKAVKVRQSQGATPQHVPPPSGRPLLPTHPTPSGAALGGVASCTRCTICPGGWNHISTAPHWPRGGPGSLSLARGNSKRTLKTRHHGREASAHDSQHEAKSDRGVRERWESDHAVKTQRPLSWPCWEHGNLPRTRFRALGPQSTETVRTTRDAQPSCPASTHHRTQTRGPLHHHVLNVKQLIAAFSGRNSSNLVRYRRPMFPRVAEGGSTRHIN
jgi:hypothetical protein